MTRFVVHIGDGKCGSSSIQASLHEARQALGAAGVIFETATPRTGHFNFATLMGRETRGNAGRSAEMARQSLQMIRDALRPDDTVLLTAESFFGVPPARLVALLRGIDPQIDRLDLIAYLRAPHAMYLSLVQQTLKGDSRFVMPDRYARRIDHMLEAWQACAAVDSLTVRNFDRTRLIENDVVADFEHLLRMLTGRSEIRLPRATENTTLTAEQLVVLQCYRARCLKAHDGKLHRDSQTVIRYFETLTALGVPGSKPALTARALASLRRGNAPIVSALNARFPALALGLPDISETGAETAWSENGEVGQILARVDPAILDLVETLVTGIRPHVSDPEIVSLLTRLRQLAGQHGIAADPIVVATVRFWREMRYSVRADRLERLHASSENRKTRTGTPSP